MGLCNCIHNYNLLELCGCSWSAIAKHRILRCIRLKNIEKNNQGMYNNIMLD